MMTQQMLTLWLILCVVVIETSKPEFSFSGNSFTNMVVYDGKIYIGARNKIYVLNASNLEEEKTVATCTRECDNVNMVLVLNEKLKQLISCGTGHGGICELRNLSSIDNIQYRTQNGSGSSTYYLVVSTNKARPAYFIWDTSELYTGVTYDPGILETSNSYDCYLAKYSIASENKLQKNEDTCLKLELKQTNPEDYIVYFKAGFQHKGYIYFLTNQRFKVGASNYSSKIIRVCENDTAFYSYTDILLKCERDSIDYNLVQDVSIFEPGQELADTLYNNKKIVAATFAAGANPEQPEENSAICLYDIDDIDEHIIKAKRNFITCPHESLNTDEKYLLDARGKDGRPLCTETLNDDQSFFTCDNALEGYVYIVGGNNSTLSTIPAFTTATEQLGKIQGTKSGKYTALHVGTSRGTFYKLNVDSNRTATEYEKDVVDDGQPITGIHIEADGKTEYIMSSGKVVRYEMEDCSMYTTCPAVMEAKNPLCGWCVYENKSTFQEINVCQYHQNGSYHWLSSLSKCLSLTIEPRGVRVEQTVKVNATVEGGLPARISNEEYQCKIVQGKQEKNKSVNTQGENGNLFSCTTPSVQEHTEGTVAVYVVVKGVQILLAETIVLFYECGHYESCGDCTGDDRAVCAWDPVSTTCIDGNNTTSGLINIKDQCPKFQNNFDMHYLPSGFRKELTFNVTNLVNSADTRYQCKLNDSVEDAVKVDDTQISCNLMAMTNSPEENGTLEILYGTSKLDGNNTVVIYNCGELGKDCSVCRSLNDTKDKGYVCDWCAEKCVYPTASCTDPCPSPTVTSVVPNTAAVGGNVTVTIFGSELGSSFEEVDNITLAGVSCERMQEKFSPSRRVLCVAQKSDVNVSGNVQLFVNNQISSGNANFSYKTPVIEKLIPEQGPKIGGTRLTIEGQNLGVGGRNVMVIVRNTKNESKECTDAKVTPDTDLRIIPSKTFDIECNIPSGSLDKRLDLITITFDGATTRRKAVNFTYLENPLLDDMPAKKGIASGGIRLTFTGKNLKNAHKGRVLALNKEGRCEIISPTVMYCTSPELPEEKKKLLDNKKVSGSRRKRDTESSVDIQIVVHLDGYEKSFSIFYYSDPAFDSFEDEDKVKLFESAQQKLTIKGKNLNLVADKGDVMVTIGVENCTVIELRENNLTCVAPTNQPVSGIAGSQLPEVNVSIGNVHASLGYLKYTKIPNEGEKLLIIIAPVAGSVLAIFVIVIVIVACKYRQKSKKMRDYERHVEEQEMEIKNIFREEFADMHTSMLVVNNNLIEQGCPYHHYQQYVFNFMFPADELESHPLVQEPVVSTKVTDTMRSKMKRGMEEFESLIFNKYFLMSVIYSLEKQRKFGLKDKANMAGYICTVLLGRMEYLQEILQDMVGNLVQESDGKKNQKVLFRRCETVTEKLLSNWLQVCLYPDLKSQSGCPLYLLYKATQLHMEAGPIDAITNDAKYTLSEEKLLKKYSQHSKQGSNEPTFEAKCLTLNVVVDNCRDIKICRVLDCDTITQVKEKCLTQIYVNYPASNLTVRPEELELEWHAGRSGSLRLRDIDNTSKRSGRWVRLNTLAHYNVQDESNMALIDPQVADESQEQDYANLAQVQVSCVSDTSIDSTDAATAALVDEESGENTARKWHIVKPEESTLAQGLGKSLITELYLNRLLTFKQSILEYVRAMFDTVLTENTLPPHVQYFYHLLDSLADKHKVEADILHAWKSMSYPVRIWATLIKKPSLVFDIKSPQYVDTSMDVISQVFIECFSLEAHKFSKDSPTQKLIFTNEMNQYKEKVKQFYKRVSVMESQDENLRKYLEEVNKLQQQHITFNKMSALYKLYQQIEPYIEEVIDDLATNKDACKLHLDKKLESINGLMGEDE